MAQKVNIVLVDDIDGSEATQTVTFGLDGATYEIDLNDDHAAGLRDALDEPLLVGHALGVEDGAHLGPQRLGGGALGTGPGLQLVHDGGGVDREGRGDLLGGDRGRHDGVPGVLARGHLGGVPLGGGRVELDQPLPRRPSSTARGRYFFARLTTSSATSLAFACQVSSVVCW